MLQYIAMVHVVAAILEREGRILIGQRQPEQSHPLKWEFPGGKVEPGETAAQALSRELQEELGILRASGDEMLRYEYRYAGKRPITLIFFRVTSFEGEPRNLIFRDLRWVAHKELGGFDFVEGDRQFIDWFSSGAQGDY